MSEVNENTKEIVDKLGRIRYVDPSKVFGTGGAYTSNGNIPLTPEYEDLCIAFNLIIERYNRLNPKARKVYALHFTDKARSKDKDGNPIEDNKSSLLDGGLRDGDGNRYLTTFYTDISNKDIADGDIVEGLGVENIQVSFDSYYMPTAVIKFVDVRGSALFGRMETLHKDGAPTVDSLFGSFFSVPYPKFSLQMKGFYGKDVTYQLTVSKFTANFNATTGNVEATVSFVGYTWSLLTDIPFNYLIAAPYCNYVGREYWNTHMTDQAWRMENSAKTGLTRETPITLFDLFERIRYCIKNAVPDSEASEPLDENTEKQAYSLELMSNKIEQINTLIAGRNEIDITETRIEVVNDIEKHYEDLNKFIDDFNNGNSVNPIEKDIIPDKILEEKKNKKNLLICPSSPKDVTAICKYLGQRKIPVKDGGKCVFDKSKDCIFKYLVDAKPDVDEVVDITDDDLNTKNVIHPTTYTVNNIDDLKTAVNARKQGILKQRDEANARARREQIETVMRKIDIDPNIQNIFKIMMCHLETFCHIMYAANTEIVEQKRTLSYLGIEIDRTDLPSRLEPVPAWTAIFNKNKSDVNNKDEIEYSTAYEWVGNINHNWVEEKVVWSFYRAIQQTSTPKDIYLSVDDMVDNMSYPFIPSDLTSPDNIFREVVMNGTYMDFCGNIGIRMAQLMGIFDTDMYDRHIKQIAELDAYSLYKCCSGPEDLKRLFINSLNKGDIVENITNILLANTSEKATFENEGTPTSKRHPMYAKTNDGYKYVYMQTKEGNKVIDSIVPTALVKFSGDNGYSFEGDIKKELVTEGDKKYVGSYRGNFSFSPNKAIANNWMYKNYSGWGDTYKDIHNSYDISYNKNQVDIIEDGNVINMLSVMQEKLNEGNFNVNGYMVEDKYGDITNTYWSWETMDYVPYSVTKKKYDDQGIEDIVKKDIKKEYVTLDEEYWEKISSKLSLVYGHDTKWKDMNTLIADGEEISVNDLYVNSINLKFVDGDKTNGFYPLVRSFLFESQTVREIKMFMILNSLFTKGVNIGHDYGYMHVCRKVNLLLMGALLWMNKDKNYEKFVYEPKTEKKTNVVDRDGNYRKVYRKYLKEEDGKTVFCICWYHGFLIDTSRSSDKKNYMNEKFLYSPKDLKMDKLNDDTKERLIDYFVSYCKKDICDRFFQVLDTYNPKTTEDKKNKNNALWDYYIKFNNDRKKFMALNLQNDNIQDMLRDICYNSVIFTRGCVTNETKSNPEIVIPENKFKGYISNFTSTLLKIYEEKSKTAITYEEVEESDEDKANVDGLIPTYIYLKNVWEKWLLPFQGTDDENGEAHYDVKNFFDNFIFMDSYYNRIGTKLKINLEKFLDYYEGRTEDCTLFSIIGDITKGHRCMFVGMPDFVDLGFGVKNRQAEAQDKMEKLFKPVPFNKMGEPRMDNHFVVIYTYPPANRISKDETYSDDGFDIVKNDGTGTDIIGKLFSTSSTGEDVGLDKFGYEIPAFSVAFAKQNNHIFKNFNISMDNPIMTEQAIIALTNVSHIASGNDRRVSFYGQDVYNIFSDYSYSIEVEMMGNAQIQPLMYFQLMNIPMWSGTYMIYNVRHTMTPGNMVTNIKAMKLSKHPVPFISSYYDYIERGYGEGLGNTYGGYNRRGSESFDFLGKVPKKVEILPNFGTAPDGNVDDWLYKNHGNENCLKVENNVRTLFNQLYEEIMNIPGNKLDDTGKCKWNIYATSGLRPEGSKKSDHYYLIDKNENRLSSKTNTLDIQIQVNGNRLPSGTAMDVPYYYMVLAILYDNHLGEFDRVMIEYPSISEFYTSCNNNNLHCLHLSCTKNPNGADCGPFINVYREIIEKYNETTKKKEKVETFKFMVNHITMFGTSEKYMKYIHPCLWAMMGRDYNSRPLGYFQNVWKGVIPSDIITNDAKLKEYFHEGELTSKNVAERAVQLYNKINDIINNNKHIYGNYNDNFVLALVANAWRESGCGINQEQMQGDKGGKGIWQWTLQHKFVLYYAKNHYGVGNIQNMAKCPTEIQIKIALDQTLRNLVLYEKGYKLDGKTYGECTGGTVDGKLKNINKSAEEISDDIIDEWLRPENRKGDKQTSRKFLKDLKDKLHK